MLDAFTIAMMLCALAPTVLFCVNLLVLYGLTHMSANRAIVILLFELVVVAITSYYWAKEVLSAREWLGGAMIVAASAFSGMMDKEHREQA